MTDLTRQAGLYIAVGVWNTLFGTAVYFGFVWFFADLGRYGYMLAAVAGNIIAISESFLTYKLLVFRTKGNWLSEYVKCWLVYGGAALINMAFLPFCVEGIRWFSPVRLKDYAPYLGGLLMTGLTITISFVGHKNITFKRQIGNSQSQP